MQDLYLSIKDLKENFDTENELDNVLHKKFCRILLNDVDNNSINNMIDDPNDEVFNIFKDLGVSPYSGKIMMDALRNSEKIDSGISRTLLFLHDKDLAESIEKNYGIKCILDSKGLTSLKKGHVFSLDDEGDSEVKSWYEVFQDIDILPSNTLILNDHYLKGNDLANKNLSKIINLLTRKSSRNITLHILVICSDEDFEKKVKYSAESLHEKISVFKNGVDAIIEFVGCNKKNELHELWRSTHDRIAYSNYTSIDATHQLAAFRENGITSTPAISQKIIVGNILYDAVLSGLNSTIKHIKKALEFPDRSKKTSKYQKYIIQNGELTKNNDQLEKLQNRFIIDESKKLKEDEKCYYLNVPNNNDWANIEISLGFYSAANLSECIFAKTPEDEKLLKKKVDLQNLFRQTQQFEVPADEETQYWEIVTNYQSTCLKSIYVDQSRQGEKVHDQTGNYLINCFKYKYDAMCVVNKIAEILEISHIYSEEEMLKAYHIKQAQQEKESAERTPHKCKVRNRGKSAMNLLDKKRRGNSFCNTIRHKPTD